MAIKGILGRCENEEFLGSMSHLESIYQQTRIGEVVRYESGKTAYKRYYLPE